MTPINIPPVLADWCSQQLGPFTVLKTYPQEQRDSQVWRLSTEDKIVYLKAYHSLTKWGMEVHAYENWVAALGTQAPRALAILAEPIPAILLTELSGSTMDCLKLEPEQEQILWRLAGATLAQLHALPSGQWFGVPLRDGSSLAEFPETNPVSLISSSLEAWLRRGVNDDLLMADEIQTIQQALAIADIFAGETPTPCHGDYQPRNWMVTQSGNWQGVIDFEHARWDLKMSDLGYWWDRGLRERPHLKAAFWDGYGKLGEPEHRQLAIIRILGATGRVIWGRRYGDQATEKLGHCVLEELAQVSIESID